MSRYSRRLPPLGSLVAFEAACRHGNFTRAGDEIALTQASVSRRVRELEDSVRVKLFERRRHDVAPTAEGEALVRVVRQTLDSLAGETERIRRSVESANGLTVYSDISIASNLIAPSLGMFQRAHPDTRVRLLSSYESIADTVEEFDLGFQVGDPGIRQMRVEPFADDAVFPVCSPEFAQHLPSPLDSVALLQLPLLHLEYADRGWPDWQQLLGTARLKQPVPRPELVFNSYQVCLDMAERGEGIALGWARSVASKLADRRLQRISDLYLYLPQSVYVFRPPRTANSATVDDFLRCIRDGLMPIEALLQAA